ncbi:MAG: hypothetical protein Fur002_21090 [Anaerolineales bacterium]
MIKKLTPTLLFFLGALHVWSAAQWNDTLYKSDLRFSDYDKLLGDFKSAALLLALMLFSLAAFSLSPRSAAPQKRFWLAGFLGVLALSAAATLYVNPHARFAWNQHAEYIEIETRARKLNLYQSLPAAPDAVFFGSSVSFLLPADEFESLFGARAFNLSVNGGGAVDFLNLLHTLERVRADGNMPRLVTMEFLNPSLTSGAAAQTPLPYLRDMNSPADQARVLWETEKSLFKINSVWDAYFTAAAVDDGRWRQPLTLTSNGTMDEAEPILKEKAYLKSVEKNMALLDNLLTCESLSGEGMRAMQEIAALSERRGFALVLYRAPINADFYRLSGYAAKKYAACAAQFNQYMQRLAGQHANIFFVDLSAYEPIAAGGMAYYRDTHHLTRAGSAALLQALAPQIEAGLMLNVPLR